jgi:xanthine dehydrogenase accessory factor
LRVGIPSEIVEQLPLFASTAVVLTIHDYKIEVPVLRAVLSSEAGYVGMLGSRRRGKGVLDILREQSVPEQQLERVRVPVGLDIGAQTAAEIALSAIAQVVASRAGRSARGLAEGRP